MKPTYPTSPEISNTDFLKPGKAFRINALKVLFAIIFFIITYLAMIAVAGLFGLLCWYAGLAIKSLRISYISLLLGIGLWVVALMIIFFLIKFLFSSKKTDRSGMIEVTKETEPELFNFIKVLTNETGTPFPKKIFLSPDVNASVSYDSSFWSMFLPVRKNLTIGLGLVNSVNISEFKAIMAHEFGHFSQRSMKLGSYIYNVNQIIYNMLYDNDGYAKLLDKWAETHGIFYFMAQITLFFVKAIQHFLQIIYSFINKMYASLSLQMEFHADAVAASVTGGNHLVTSLYRLEASDICYNRLISYYNSWIGEGLKPDNIYKHHEMVMQHFSEEFNMSIENNLLQVTQHGLNIFNSSNLNIKNQWASHPSTLEREEALNKLQLFTPPVHQSPWILFSQPEQLQKQMTEVLFSSVTYEKQPEIFDEHLFKKKYYDDAYKYKLDPIYKGYYDSRYVEQFNLDTTATSATSIHELITDTTLMLPKQINTNTNDLQQLEQLVQSDIKTFDYKGQKFLKTEIETVKSLIEKELEQFKADLLSNDEAIYGFAKQRGDAQQAQQLQQLYTFYFNQAEIAKAANELLVQFQQHIYEAYRNNIAIADAINWNTQLKEKEQTFIESLKNLINDEKIKPLITEQQQTIINKYLSTNYAYFIEPSFQSDNIMLLNEVVVIYADLMGDSVFNAKKQALNLQATLLA